MLSEIDQYKILCVSRNKKPSGRKLNVLESRGSKAVKTNAEIYSIAHKIEIPCCEICQTNKVQLKSFSEGFRKYCSKTCYSIAQSERNKRNNKQLNQRLAEKKRKEKIEIYGESLDSAIEQYTLHDNTYSIHEIAEKHNIPYGFLRQFLLERFDGKIPTQKKTMIWRKKIKSKMSDVDVFLADREWILEQQQSGKTTSMISNELGCSSNYVASKAREIGIPFPNNRSTSSCELLLKDFLEQHNQMIEMNNRKILSGLEIDLFVPDKNLGIEVNGVYWHQYHENDATRIDKLYHKRKTDLSEEKGIRLIQIFDYELNDERKKSIIQSMLLGICQLNKNIFARKCFIQPLDSVTYKNFLHENHIKGVISSKVKLGLFYHSELVMVAGFSKPRFNKNYQWELIRLCSKKGVTVVGGATKLFKNFLKLYSPSSIISYCDRRLFFGSVYEKMGMVNIGSNVPNYTWVKNYGKEFEVVSRYQSQKHKILDENTKHLTEDQIMRQNKYMKIYDCGQSVFVWRAMEEQAINSLQPLVHNFCG
jgi:hypothetical protein